MLTRLGTFVVRYRLLIILFWLCLLIPAFYGSSHLHEVLQGEVTSAKGGEMYRQEALLNKEFPEQYLYNILIVLQNPQQAIEHPSYQALLQEYMQVAQNFEGAAPPVSYEQDPSMLSRDHHSTFVYIGLMARNYKDADILAEHLSEKLRQVKIPQGYSMRLTGGPLFGREITTVSAKDGFETEKHILPIVGIVLIFAFGGLVAAGLPLLMGMMSSMLTLGILYILAHFLEITSLSQNIVSMLGLGVGIDYSLLIVNRFREELFDKGLPKEEAAIRTVESAGRTILYSGTVVSIGLVALLVPNVVFMHSLGLSGLIVVLITILLGLTLLPAVLSYLGDRINTPRRLVKMATEAWGQSRFWYKWAKYIMSRPLFFGIVSISMLICLSLFTFEMRLWNTTIRIMPDAMETKQGFEQLLEIDGKYKFAPILMTFSTKDKSPIWQEKNIADIYHFMQAVQNKEPIASMVGLVNTAQPLDAHMPLYNTIAGYGGIAGMRVFQPGFSLPYISQDESQAALMMYHKWEGYGITESGEDMNTIRDIREFRDLLSTRFPNLEILVGGMSAIPVEMQDAIYGNFPFIIIMTVLVTSLLTMFSFGSLLLPLKAVFLNLLSVTATYGCMVLVFQKGLGAHLLGIDILPEALMMVSPLILFCIIFGLSMDYEIFLLNRIREEYDAGATTEEAIAIGMEKTGGIITSAGLIMILVFLGFALARLIVIKEFGLGLAIAIFIDATIIRLMVVPALMKLFGSANWYLPKFLDIPLLRKVLKD
jgi:putative drug exporter of the RND superfamily